jgi:hypothetical protein
MTTPADQLTAKGWTADDSTFGARLALIRQRMGWGNVKEAATACGLPAESWRTWERDGVGPRRLIDVAEVISERTGCDFGWLVAGQRLNRSATGDLNRSLKSSRKDDPKPVRHVAPRRFGPPRRDPNGPPSATPLSSRRPRDTRPVKRPMAVAS